jgi:type IV secretion system protein VirB2
MWNTIIITLAVGAALIVGLIANRYVRPFAKTEVQGVKLETLTGPIATSLAILAVIAAGFLAFVGRLNWFFAGSIIFGIVLVFGSAQIVSFFQSAVGGGGGG